jgi:hypothetical protein
MLSDVSFLASLMEAEVDTKVRGYKWTGNGCGMEILWTAEQAQNKFLQI